MKRPILEPLFGALLAGISTGLLILCVVQHEALIHERQVNAQKCQYTDQGCYIDDGPNALSEGGLVIGAKFIFTGQDCGADWFLKEYK